MTRRLLLVCMVLAGCGRAERADAPAASDSAAARWAAALAASEARLASAPEDAALLFEVGWRRAGAEERAAALALLERVVATGAGLDPEGTPYDGLVGDPAYRALLARIRRENPPVTDGVPAFTIPEPDLIPEGIAFDSASRRFFVGSLAKRKIVAVSPDGAVTDFVPSGRDGLVAVLGLRVDAPRRLLWAACLFRSRAGEEAGEHERSGVAAFDLATGRMARRIVLDSAGHLLNDLVVTRSGDLYVTDTEAGALYTLAPGGDRLDLIIDSTRVFRPNGIALAPDESRLFVAAWPAIVVVEPRTRAVTPLRQPPHVVTGGVDGLYFHEGSLVGVQNDVHPGRVVRYWLSPGLDSIVRAEVLQSYHPRFAQPTTGAIAGDGFYLLANPQLAKLRPDWTTVPLEQLDPVVILRVALRPARP
jgi:hypothetical protein